MFRISPIKIAAALAAVTLAVTVLFYASEARQATVNILSGATKSPRPSGSQTAAPAHSAATASGVRVIPIGVASTPSSGNAGRANGQ